MRRFLLGFLLIVGCAGCQGGAPVPEATSTAADTSHPAVQPFNLAGPLEPSQTVGLYRQRSSVKVGDSWDKARAVFPEPLRGAYELHDLPPGIPAQFEAHGWETGLGEGFGVITTEGKIAAAMYQLERTNEDTVQEFLQELRDGTGNATPVSLTGPKARFWFWSGKTQTLMMCAYTTPRGIDVTMAMGDNGVLHVLGISPNDAGRDEIRLGGSALFVGSAQLPGSSKTGERSGVPAR